MNLTDAVAALEAEPLPATLKSLSSKAVGLPMSAIGGLGLNVLAGDLPLPAALLKESALTHNLRWMRGFTTGAGVSHCPHGKTMMAPQLFERQMQEGCWGITAATASHVRTYRQFGVPRVLMANQLIGRANIMLVLDELRADPEFDFYCLVDSFEGLRALQLALAEKPLQRPLQVFLEVGTPGGRTGIRTLEGAIELGRHIQNASPAIALRGIETFEDVVSGKEQCCAEATVTTMLETVCELVRIGVAESWFAPGQVILSAGGSSFYDIATQVLRTAHALVPLRVVIRSGCYISHDSFHYAKKQPRIRERAGALWGAESGLVNALEVWALVQSVPEPGRAICGLGKRDVSYDISVPQPLWWFRPGLHCEPQPAPDNLKLTTLFDQHAYVDSDGSEMPWRVGDLVGFGIAHPCTTFDKWPLLHVVNDSYAVQSAVRTFF